jgi:pyruvate dehydrogenase E1 component
MRLAARAFKGARERVSVGFWAVGRSDMGGGLCDAFAPAGRNLTAERILADRMTESPKLEDLDPVETQEWLESIDSVLKTHGAERAHFLLERLIDYSRRSGAYLPFKPNTAYVNTIPTGQEREYPGNRALERRMEAYFRWNALAMVVQANRQSAEYGGHLSSYASSATLYEVGFNHF